MVCIRRSGESGLTQGVLFPLHYEQTIQGTISRFHILLANFWLSLTSAIFWAVTITVYHSGSYTNLKAGQSWGPETVCLQPSICSGGSRDACRHSKHFKQALDSLSRAFYFGSWILKDFRLCTFVLFRSSFWILDIGHDRFLIWLNLRGEIYFSLKELFATFKKVRFTTCRDTRFGRTLWNEEIVSAGRIPRCVAWFCIRPVPEELITQASTP